MADYEWRIMKRAFLLLAFSLCAFSLEASSLAEIHASTCRNTLMILEGAKEMWALDNKKGLDDAVQVEELKPHLPPAWAPSCPDGGTYQFGTVRDEVRCSVHQTIKDFRLAPDRVFIDPDAPVWVRYIWGNWFLIVFFVFWLACGCFTSKVAREKGYSGGWWFLGGFFFGFFALLASVGLPDRLARLDVAIGQKVFAMDGAASMREATVIRILPRDRLVRLDDGHGRVFEATFDQVFPKV